MSAAEPKPARRRLRFTLRGLLFVVTVVALVFAWLNHHYRAAIDEAAFIAEFQAIILSTENARASRAERGLDPSLKVTYDYQWDADGNFLPNAEPRGPSFLRNWLGEHLFDRVHTIEIDTEDNSLYFEDNSTWDVVRFPNLANIGRVKNLKRLHIDAIVRDSNFEELRNLDQLKDGERYRNDGDT